MLSASYYATIMAVWLLLLLLLFLLFCTAGYLAERLNPENKFVVALKQKGIAAKHIVQVLEDAPKEVRTWVKKEHNNWHSGTSNLLTEHIDLVDICLARWELFRHANGIQTSTCPAKGTYSYEARFKKFVASSHNELSNWEYFDNLKSFMGRLRRWT